MLEWNVLECVSSRSEKKKTQERKEEEQKA